MLKIWSILVICLLKCEALGLHPQSTSLRTSRACCLGKIHAVPPISSIPQVSLDDLRAAHQSLVTSMELAAAQTSEIDMTYAFMLPTAIAVSVLAISAGIGGAALFAPILLIFFPLLGPEYPLQSASASVATAILVETFGFSSGCLGYLRRNLIDGDIALEFSAISVPVAILSAKYLTLDPVALKILYSALMLALSAYFLLGGTTDEEVSVANDSIDCDIEPVESCVTRFDTAGNEYEYDTRVMTSFGGIATALGGGLTGVLGVGIGEVVLPQLLRRGVPVPVAAASSTLCVTFTALSAAMIQISSLMTNPEGGGLSVVPWNLLQFMIPGVLIGGQIAARLQGKVPQEQLEKAIGTLFGAIGASFAVLTYYQTH